MPTSGPTLFDMERLCQKMPDFADRAQELPNQFGHQSPVSRTERLTTGCQAPTAISLC